MKKHLYELFLSPIPKKGHIFYTGFLLGLITVELLRWTDGQKLSDIVRIYYILASSMILVRTLVGVVVKNIRKLWKARVEEEIDELIGN